MPDAAAGGRSGSARATGYPLAHRARSRHCSGDHPWHFPLCLPFSTGDRIVESSCRRLWCAPEIVGGGCDNGAVIETELDPRQAMVACLDQWRRSIVGGDDAGLPDQVRDIESVSRIVYSVMLDVRSRN